ncbi:hypothetical protein [Pseudoalteromonas luteoviolacea]|uniref:Uncharacterized protein n=1 Tax=Pseudoalteromonas luteoviolacea S4060-1 TaxID=1365257 RepID=A0A167IA53_9GAMM|nr:hypothetical protein [Pseudoalteromonas luteoviolacea]KZN59104.1 hypothetical protein N478_08735 [Pseudoalteromonas luteoviolacea S4060-1]
MVFRQHTHLIWLRSEVYTESGIKGSVFTDNPHSSRSEYYQSAQIDYFADTLISDYNVPQIKAYSLGYAKLRAE